MIARRTRQSLSVGIMVGPAGLPVFPLLMRQPYHREARHATLRKGAPSVFKRAPSVFKRAPSVFKRAPSVRPNPSCRHPTCKHPTCKHPSCRAPSCARAARPARRHPNRPDAQPPRSRPAPWGLVHLPHPPAPAPQGAGGGRGGLKNIEQTTTPNETRGRPRNRRSARTRCPSTRKGPGRKAKPQACPNVTVGLGRRVSFSLLAPPLPTVWFASWLLWSCVLGEGLVGTPSVSLLAPRFTPAAKTPAQTRCKAPRAA